MTPHSNVHLMSRGTIPTCFFHKWTDPDLIKTSSGCQYIQVFANLETHQIICISPNRQSLEHIVFSHDFSHEHIKKPYYRLRFRIDLIFSGFMVDPRGRSEILHNTMCLLFWGIVSFPNHSKAIGQQMFLTNYENRAHCVWHFCVLAGPLT